MSDANSPVAIVDATVAAMPADAATLDGQGGETYGLVRDAALVVANGRVAWLGQRRDLPASWRHAEPYSAEGRLVTPGLIECHSQLLFSGDGSLEQAAPASCPGDSKAAAHGNGIRATATATRAASDEDILAAAARRAWWFIRQGVTTLEVKTGYGLDPGSELRLLRLAGQLRAVLPIRVSITLLAGHTYPAGGEREEYILQVCDTLLPAAIEQGGFDFIEVYCEDEAGICLEDASTILETVYRKKIPTRVSADQFSDSAGGGLAPAFYSAAVAHLDFTDEVAVTAMGKAGTTAILTPVASLELGLEGHLPPVGLLRESDVHMAVSTGCHPRTAPLADVRVAAHLACTLFGLSLPEAMHGITTVAARALSLDDGAGTLVPGGRADLAIWDAAHPEELIYWLGAPICREVWSSGSSIELRQPAR